MMVVDMPGYGFAFADEGKKDQWQALVRALVIQWIIRVASIINP